MSPSSTRLPAVFVMQSSSFLSSASCTCSFTWAPAGILCELAMDRVHCGCSPGRKGTSTSKKQKTTSKNDKNLNSEITVVTMNQFDWWMICDRYQKIMEIGNVPCAQSIFIFCFCFCCCCFFTLVGFNRCHDSILDLSIIPRHCVFSISLVCTTRCLMHMCVVRVTGVPDLDDLVCFEIWEPSRNK